MDSLEYHTNIVKVTIIIPTYNEKENIGELLKATLKVIRKDLKNTYSILVVDDNSPDGTGDLVNAFANKFKNIKLLSETKKGLGKAMVNGYKFALKNMHPDVVVTTEADFAYDPIIIPGAVQKIKDGYDVVIASRHVDGGTSHGWTLSRKLNHWVANKLFASWVAGINQIYDHNGAFRVIRVKGVLDHVRFNEIRLSGFGFFNYFLFKLTEITDKFYEFPVNYKFRTKGESKVSFNPKYIMTYLHDVGEYITLCVRIRLESLDII